jgi:hypothetical protein
VVPFEPRAKLRGGFEEARVQSFALIFALARDTDTFVHGFSSTTKLSYVVDGADPILSRFMPAQVRHHGVICDPLKRTKMAVISTVPTKMSAP